MTLYNPMYAALSINKGGYGVFVPCTYIACKLVESGFHYFRFSLAF